MATSFEFHYESVSVSLAARGGGHDSAVRRLGEDFRNFPEGRSAKPSAEIVVVLDGVTTSKVGRGGRTRFTKRYSLFPRVCDHGGGTVSRISRRGKVTEIVVHGSETDHVYEVAYVAVLSLLGWELEKSGFVRLHALGLNFDGSAALFQLPPKGGKSTLALESVESGVDVLGDEVMLVRDGQAFAFPIRAAVSSKVAGRFGLDGRRFHRKSFDEKTLVSLPRVSLEPVPVQTLVFQSRAGLAETIGKAGLTDLVVWSISTCLGLGLPQMREFIVRAEEIPWFAIVFWRRLVFVCGFSRRRTLKVGRGVSVSGSNELRPRLEWARSSLGTTAEESAGSRSRLPSDKARVERG